MWHEDTKRNRYNSKEYSKEEKQQGRSMHQSRVDWENGCSSSVSSCVATCELFHFNWLVVCGAAAALTWLFAVSADEFVRLSAPDLETEKSAVLCSPPSSLPSPPHAAPPHAEGQGSTLWLVEWDEGDWPYNMAASGQQMANQIQGAKGQG